MTQKRRAKARGGYKPAFFDVWKAAMAYTQDETDSLLTDHVSLIQGYIRNRDHATLATIRDDIAFEYLNAHSNRVLMQIEAFFSKNAQFADDQLCRRKATEKFIESEQQCEVTNRRLWYFYNSEKWLPYDDPLYGLVRRMRSNILSLLGDYDRFLNDLPGHFKISSGASSTRKKKYAQPYRKIGKRIPITRGALPLLEAYFKLRDIPIERNSFQMVDANKIAFVPKSWKTHRTIAAEPEGSVFIQLGVDKALKKRLKMRGIDLTSQERNQELAREGSLTGHLATVDLSSASDTVALELVPFLFPEEWSTLLLSLRTPRYCGELEGFYHKFSSMGNGITFPLETIVFWAAAKAVGSETISVYGDDIIINSNTYDKLSELLSFLGFSINHSKTFSTGPFRESCGSDYWRGVNVRPFFIRSDSRRRKSEVCHVINGLASLSYPSSQLSSYLRKVVRTARLPFVPWNESTISGIHVSATKAHSLKLLSQVDKDGTHTGILRFFGYCDMEKTRTLRNSKTYLLWFQESSARLKPLDWGWSSRTNALRFSEQHTVTSVVGCARTHVRRIPVVWKVPASKTPSHLYWWEDFLFGGIA